MVSPAGEHAPVKEHVMVKGEAHTQEKLVQALVEQQAMDHEFLQQMAEAVRALYTEVEVERTKRQTSEAEAAQMDLGLRRELYAVRDQLAKGFEDEVKKVPDVLNSIFENGPR